MGEIMSTASQGAATRAPLCSAVANPESAVEGIDAEPPAVVGESSSGVSVVAETFPVGFLLPTLAGKAL